MQNRGREREGCKGGGAIEGHCLCLMMVVLRRNQEGLQRRVSGGNIYIYLSISCVERP